MTKEQVTNWALWHSGLWYIRLWLNRLYLAVRTVCCWFMFFFVGFVDNKKSIENHQIYPLRRAQMILHWLWSTFLSISQWKECFSNLIQVTICQIIKLMFNAVNCVLLLLYIRQNPAGIRFVGSQSQFCWESFIWNSRVSGSDETVPFDISTGSR